MTLRSRVLAYEEQFGIPSSDVHDAIEDGRLQETLEVCEWIIDFERLDPSYDDWPVERRTAIVSISYSTIHDATLREFEHSSNRTRSRSIDPDEV